MGAAVGRKDKHLDEIETSPSEIEGLIKRLERNELTPEDRALNVRLLRLVLSLVALLQKKNATISALKRLLFGPSSDRRAPASRPDPAPSPEAEAPAPAEPAPKRPGHGRMRASAFSGARRVEVPHPELSAGSPCPHCDGRLFGLSDPAVLIRREGSPPITATAYARERLRCSSCQSVFTAPLPEGVPPERFAPSADATIAVLRYWMGQPWYRTAQLQRLAGVPLPASVQFERCERTADAVAPVVRALERLASSADLLYADDTRVRILSLRPEIEREREGARAGRARTGLHTSGMVASDRAPAAGPRIALYRSGRRHAGENSAGLRSTRPEGLAPPIRMGDAAPSNRTGAGFVEAACWAHARRKLVEVEEAFPQEAAHVLDRIAALYETDERAKGLSPGERLALHRRESGPMLEGLRAWIEEAFAERRVEPNSALGGALAYLLNAWGPLTEFLRTAGVPLDNNEAERVLKVAVRQRKNSLFYKTEPGAWIGDVLQSAIETCALNGVDPVAYLADVVGHREEVAADPGAWVPWVWAGRRAASGAGEAAAA